MPYTIKPLGLYLFPVSAFYLKQNQLQRFLSSKFFKADLHGAILSHATSLRHAYDTKKSRSILKHVLKPYDNRGLKSVARNDCL